MWTRASDNFSSPHFLNAFTRGQSANDDDDDDDHDDDDDDE